MRPSTRVSELYESGEVKRMHTVQTVRHHTVAEHVYGSLLHAAELCKLSPSYASFAVVATTLLYHDAPESYTGDVPAPVKRKSLAVKDALDLLEHEYEEALGYETPQLTERERDIVKACDTLDLMAKCVMEVRLGNKTERLQMVMQNVVNYISAQYHVPGVPDFVDFYNLEWQKAGGMPVRR